MPVPNPRTRFDNQVLADLERRHDDVLERLADLEQRIDALLRSVHPSQSGPPEPLPLKRLEQPAA
ncbi:MAG: hypothetical protein KatS3mg110_4139 [Pirellulaceae bacterium]|nr:MAG: hypothetical protein KatS3mg110_4139 [Pirellulaceae bacterium]